MRPVPEEFPAICNTMAIMDLMCRFGARFQTVKAWFDMAGIERVRVYRRTVDAERSRPADFEAVCGTMTQKELCEHYAAGRKAVARWCKEIGGKPAKPVQRRVAPAPRVRKATPKPAKPARLKVVAPKQTMQAPRDYSLLGRAADHLRRQGWIVTRRNSAGHFDPKGDHYRVGNMPLMSADEMLAFADRKGFSQMERAA